MRLLIALLLATSSASALLTDPAGDVAIDHCNSAQTPVAGFDSMDLRALRVSDTPTHFEVWVQATGLAREANYDSGNYFVHLRNDEKHYALRLYQDNAGTGAIADIVATDGVSIFGPTTVSVPASVQGDTIYAALPKNQLRDQDGKFPVGGDVFEDIFVSAQAHATGVYACPDLSGPAIIVDNMPDSRVGESYDIRYGQITTSGPVDYWVPLPYRASNGEATTYEFVSRITNPATTEQVYSFDAALPNGWEIFLPEPVAVEPEATVEVSSFIQVPFNHVHGETLSATLAIESAESSATADIGIHYLTTAQPAGHHNIVYLHALAALGVNTQAEAAMGGGDHILYWNTVEKDDSDHNLPISSRTEGGDLVWYGCLLPALQLGMHPVGNFTGSFSFELTSDLALDGQLTGAISLVPDGPRPEICQDASGWEREEIMELTPVDVSINGPTRVEGSILALIDEPRKYMPGSDLLLELRISSNQNPIIGGTVDLLPGGSMALPLLDFHQETTFDFEEEIAKEAAAEAQRKASEAAKDAPAPALWIVVAAVLVARRVLK